MSPDTSGPEQGRDWTAGRPALLYQHCGACGRVWYFARTFCPHCGSHRLESRDASGRGTVYAATTVSRAPSAALRELAPYRILLIDAEEGFRMMAHGAPDLAIGDRVQVRFQRFGESLVPLFEPRGQP